MRLLTFKLGTHRQAANQTPSARQQSGLNTTLTFYFHHQNCPVTKT